MKLGDNIQKLRKKTGLSQEQLGDKLEVTRQTISNWELGVTQPNPDQLKQLSKEFNVSIDELVDNDINNVIVEKVTKTEKTANSTLKILVIFILVIIIGFGCLAVLKLIDKNKDRGRKIEESIHCTIYGEEHSFGITYYELTGEPVELGGDAYFSDILDLGKYNDAHQIFNVINDYVKKNGGTCHMVQNNELNELVDITIKEGTLTNKGATIIIESKADYEITYGESFWVEKLNNNEYEKLPVKGDGCMFIMIAYTTNQEKKELDQNWSCMYDILPKGKYRLVKEMGLKNDATYNAWVEFEIE